MNYRKLNHRDRLLLFLNVCAFRLTRRILSNWRTSASKTGTKLECIRATVSSKVVICVRYVRGTRWIFTLYYKLQHNIRQLLSGRFRHKWL